MPPTRDEVFKDLDQFRHLGPDRLGERDFSHLAWFAAGGNPPTVVDQPLAIETLVRSAVSEMPDESVRLALEDLLGLTVDTRPLSPGQRAKHAGPRIGIHNHNTFRMSHQPRLLDNFGDTDPEADGSGTLVVSIAKCRCQCLHSLHHRES